MSGPTRWLSLRKPAPEQTARYAGLELLSTAVIVIDADARVAFANQSAEHLFEVSRRILIGQLVARLFTEEAVIDRKGVKVFVLVLRREFSNRCDAEPKQFVHFERHDSSSTKRFSRG